MVFLICHARPQTQMRKAFNEKRMPHIRDAQGGWCRRGVDLAGYDVPTGEIWRVPGGLAVPRATT
jgi:hypothetical protein